MEGEIASRDIYGPWTVTWRPAGFSVRCPAILGNGSFLFKHIILPIDICMTPALESGHALLKLDPFNLAEVLRGARRPELERFKRRCSAEVVAAVKVLPYGCADCASEAGLRGVSWSDGICPGCREYFCRSHRCLRRLRLVVLRDGATVCKYCGTPNETALPRPLAR